MKHSLRLLLPLFLVIVLTGGSCSSDGGKESETPDNSASEGFVEEEASAEADPEGEPNGQAMAPSGLVVRDQPGTNGKKLGKVPYKGKLKILKRDGPEQEIEQKKSRWFKVMAQDGLEGWAFAGFILTPSEKPYCYCPAAQAYEVHSDDLENGFSNWAFKDPNSVSKGIRFGGEALLPCFIVVHGGYEISNSGKWMVSVQATDIVGSLHVLNLQTGKHFTYGVPTGAAPKWKGESITFFRMTGKTLEPEAGESHPYWEESEEVVFENGKISKTGKTGRVAVH